MHTFRNYRYTGYALVTRTRSTSGTYPTPTFCTVIKVNDFQVSTVLWFVYLSDRHKSEEITKRET